MAWLLGSMVVSKGGHVTSVMGGSGSTKRGGGRSAWVGST